jgi:hypothetical protein
MPRPRRRNKDVESDGVFGSTNLSNGGGTRLGGRFDKRKRYALAGVVVLIVLVGYFSYNAISSAAEDAKGKTVEVGHVGFALDSKTYVPTAFADVQMMTHTKTGMPIMVVVPDDSHQDATFGISFRTPIDNNRGLATITEHAVQGGSETYPVKDPINQLKAGSLQTHLETWTERDRTSFVFASRNLQDYKNSMAVFLDGIFHPLLDNTDHEWIYRQEGWRLEVKGDEQRLALSGYVTSYVHLMY